MKIIVSLTQNGLMIYSMTGYGKAEISYKGDKIVIEIRSLNGKSADIGLKSILIPKSKEVEIRQLLSSQLQRGAIDLFVQRESSQCVERHINKERFFSYFREIEEIQKEIPQLANQNNVLSTILRIPEVMENKNYEPDEELWNMMVRGINMAVEQLIQFRALEGNRLSFDILHRVDSIELYLNKVEELETSRIQEVKERLLNKFNELFIGVQIDQNRFEQELFYYLDKLDITEEKVRLRQHCNFFKQTASNEKYPGRKLSFITQEMGREINTIGSKANHAYMQQWVVIMKDELEKIKEQLLNIV